MQGASRNAALRHVIRGEFLAIVELHPFADLEDPSIGIWRRVPFDCQQRGQGARRCLAQ